MNIHESLIKELEDHIFAGKRKLTTNERLLFKAGAAMSILYQKDVADKVGPDQFIEENLKLVDESNAVAQELKKHHAFYCENCDHKMYMGSA